MDISSRKYNVILGTQTIGAAYQFTKDPLLVETARGIAEMGSSIIKFREDTGSDIDKIGNMPFDYYFIWFRSESDLFINGMTEDEKKTEYDETYAYVKHLLETYSHTGKAFFIGHWEGDWYLLHGYDTSKEADPVTAAGMADWLNVRQKAVNDAKRDTEHENVNVYHYTEVNRVRDALTDDRKRLVNTVLPYVDVDYVSYSAYDIQKLSQNEINETLDYVEAQLKPRDDIKGKRVFIGEFAVPAQDTGHNRSKHEMVNRSFIIKFLKWGCPFIIYWEFYNNEVDGAIQKGYWLIDEKNEKWPLYDTFKAFYDSADGMLSEFQQQNGRYPTEQEFIDWSVKALENYTRSW